MAKLFLVPTPIGNLEDITLRAIAVLKNADLILAEDTRTTAVLLKHYGIETPMQSHHLHNEHKTVGMITDKIKDGRNIALVSDAGTPGISDPGFLLLRECLKNEIEIECLPGATAFVPALVMSGLPCDRFYFEGFLPQKKGRKTRLKELSEFTHTLILYESPFRLLKTLGQLEESFGEERKASVSRELTKIYEETVRGTLKEIADYYAVHIIKGEIVIIIEGKQ
jgi:16S rRNA (cytidine1402-2'-O)-methyltransferase